MIIINSVTPESAEAGLLNKGSSFRCDQIHNCYRYDLGHTLLCYLSQTEGAFTLAQFRGRFRTKLAHLEIKKNIFLAKHPSLLRNRARNLQV